MTTMLSTTASSRTYADAISDAIADAEAIFGRQFIVTRIECVAVFEPTPANPLHLHVTGYRAAVESRSTR